MKIAIIGTGRVGSAIAFALVVRRLADELVLVGRTPGSGVGDAVDLMHASAFSKQMAVSAGGVEAVAGSDIVILAASAAGVTLDRMDELRANVGLFKELVPAVVRAAPGALILVVTNPVDVMTYLAIRYSGLPAERVMGTGTLIDTARYRSLLSEHVGIDTHDIRAYILGEHGPSQFAALSVASAGGERLGTSDPMVAELADRARDEGGRVIRAKGYTNYAIAGAVAMLVEAIVNNTRSVFPVSTLVSNYCGVSDVCLSVPAVVGRGGILKVLRVDLDSREVELLKKSAAVVRGAIEKCG
jgi:L-lactate dehydrogenase